MLTKNYFLINNKFATIREKWPTPLKRTPFSGTCLPLSPTPPLPKQQYHPPLQRNPTAPPPCDPHRGTYRPVPIASPSTNCLPSPCPIVNTPHPPAAAKNKRKEKKYYLLPAALQPNNSSPIPPQEGEKKKKPLPLPCLWVFVGCFYFLFFELLVVTFGIIQHF